MKILLGISGSIAAYKAAALTRLMVKEGHEVRIIMTSSAKDFITPLTLSTLSKNPVSTEFYNSGTGEWVNHVAMAEWPELYLIAPASANTIFKLSQGACDNLLQAVYLSCTKPVLIAPAMDRDMYLHPATQHNLELLRSREVVVIPPGEGELASGLHGLGRMAEPEEIMQWLEGMK